MSLFNAPRIFIFRGNHFRPTWFTVMLIGVLVFILFQCSPRSSNPQPSLENKETVFHEKVEKQEERKEDGGSLLILDADGHCINKCMLKHTDVSTRYNETYTSLHTFWGDDIISQLFANMGQLIGKWCTEFINGWESDAIQFLTGSVKGLGTTEYPTYDGSDTSMRSLIVRGIHEALRIGAFIFLIILVLKQRSTKMLSNAKSNVATECESTDSCDTENDFQK